MLLWKRACLRIRLLLIAGVVFVLYPGNWATAELPSAPAGSFSIVVLPDTQTYSATKPDVYHAETQWIIDNLDTQRIRFVSHVGNYQNNGSSCQLFSAEGLDFVIVHLECNAPDDVLEWAHQMLARYADRQAIVTTHMYLGPRDKPLKPEDYFNAPKDRMLWTKRHGERGNSPRQMWEKCFQKHANLFMICCGDQSRTQTMHRTVRGQHGNPVHEVLCDYHEGSLRVYRFIPSEDRIQAWTYRPQQGELCQGTPIVPDAKKHHFSLPYKMRAASESLDAAKGRSQQVDNDRVVSDEQARQWRSQIRDTLFVPDVLPKLDPTQHGQLTPAPGIGAERVTYATNESVASLQESMRCLPRRS